MSKKAFTLVSLLHGTELAELDRAAALKAYRSGERAGITFGATVFVHGPNRNHVLLNEKELEQFASSFKGQPFLIDHSRKQADRGGTILDSKLIEADGKTVIRQTIQAVKQFAVEGVLDGTIDRFSIGWNAEEFICTVCGTSFFDEDEKHTFWDIGMKDKKSGKTIEVLMKGLEGMETSAVTHPAVPGTSTDEVLSQFQQLMESASGASSPGVKHPKEITMLQKILAIFGLSADVAEPEALAAIEKRLSAPAKPPAGLLAALGLGAEATTHEAIAKAYSFATTHVLRTEHERVVGELNESRADGLVRKYEDEGKVTPANRDWARGLAAEDPAEFERVMAKYPVQHPVLNAEPPVTATATKTPAGGGLTPEEEQVIARLGLNREKFIASRQKPRAA